LEEGKKKGKILFSFFRKDEAKALGQRLRIEDGMRLIVSSRRGKYRRLRVFGWLCGQKAAVFVFLHHFFFILKFSPQWCPVKNGPHVVTGTR
jgi:hypothetical protein